MEAQVETQNVARSTHSATTYGINFFSYDQINLNSLFNLDTE